MSKKLLVTIFLAIAILALAFGGGKAETKEPDQTLKIIHPVNTGNWSPFNGGGHEIRWLSLWWASPMYFDADGNVQPYVMESWKGNADSTVWEFKISDKAVFSDGSPITAKDVIGSWNLATRPSTQHQRVDLFFSGVVGYADVSAGEAELDGLVAKDDRTIEVTLTSSDPIFFQKLASNCRR